MNHSSFRRNRWFQFLSILIVIGLGLSSRSAPEWWPSFLAIYAGDTLWALLVFLLIGWLFPTQPTRRVATWALLFAFAIEISQLYHAPWIDSIRHTRLGGLVLGFGFLWSDLVCYGVGVLIGVLSEALGNRFVLR